MEVGDEGGDDDDDGNGDGDDVCREISLVNTRVGIEWLGVGT